VSTVHDVTGFTVDGDTSTSFSVQGVEEVSFVVDNEPVSVTVQADEPITQVNIEVPGIQGPPGLQNVYPQLNSPAVEYGWGMEEAGFIWIKVDV